MEKDKLTLQELAALLAEKSGFSKQLAETFCKELFSVVQEVLQNRDTLKINGLGTFKTQFVEPRRIVNIGTGKEMLIEGHNKVIFIPEKSLKEFVNQPFAHLFPVKIEDKNEIFADFEKNKFTEDLSADNLSDNMTDEPLKALEEQAVEIKNILAEINGMSAEAANTETSENIIYEIKQTENQEITKNSHEEELKARKAVLVEGKYSPFYNNEKSHLPENKEIKTKSKTHSKKKSGFWWKILLSLLLILAAAVLVYLFVPRVKTKIDEIFYCLNKTQMPVDTIFARDLLKIHPVDSLKNDSAATQNLQKDSIITSEQIKTEKEPAQQIPDYNKIRATEIVTNGTTLAALARKYYGHQDFWIYIYNANKASIKNPDNLEIGTKINVPDLDKNLTDFKNPEILKKAREMTALIIK